MNNHEFVCLLLIRAVILRWEVLVDVLLDVADKVGIR